MEHRPILMKALVKVQKEQVLPTIAAYANSGKPPRGTLWYVRIDDKGNGELNSLIIMLEAFDAEYFRKVGFVNRAIRELKKVYNKRGGQGIVVAYNYYATSLPTNLTETVFMELR